MELEDVVVLDTETTDVDPDGEKTRVIELSLVRCNSEHHTKGTQVPNAMVSYINPGEDALSDMPPDTIAYHGLIPEYIKSHGKSPKEVFKKLNSKITETDIIAGHNINFDIVVICSDMKREKIVPSFTNNMVIDTQRVVKEFFEIGEYDLEKGFLPNLKLGTCFYGILPPSWWDTQDRLNDALSDSVMCSKLIEYWVNEEGMTIESLISISSRMYVPKRCPIGKEKGYLWKDVSDGYLSWMASKEVWGDDEGFETAVLVEMEKRRLI